MKARILVVEDDRAVQQTIADALSDEGYDVVTASGGEAALEHLSSASRGQLDGQPDLILLDLFMPVMDGREFINAYRALDVPHAPIITVTAARDAEQRAAQVGADGVLLKPFAVGDLLREVERRLSHRHSTAPL